MEKLLLDKPDNPIQFIIDHLSSTYPESVMRGAPTQDESVAASLLHSSGGSKGEEKTSTTLDFSDSDDYDDSDDDISEMQSIPMARRTRRRTAISAAPLNMKEIKTEAPQVFEKTPSIATGIRNILSKNILFQQLDQEQLNTVVNAFQPMDFQNGTVD